MGNQKEKESLKSLSLYYYEHQYRRVARLENYIFLQHYFATIISMFCVVVTFFLVNKYFVKAILVFVVFINLFSITIVERLFSWMTTHRLRAKAFLKKYDSELYDIDKSTFAPHNSRSVEKEKLVLIFHKLLIIFVLISILITW